MITLAPLPRWLDLARSVIADGSEAAAISPWLKPMDSGFLTPRTAWALAALARAAADLQGLAPRVLLPAWICNQSLWPLRQTGAELIFLPVLADGRMDWAAANGLGAVEMVVAPHYFGFAAEMEPARDFANSRNALLIEDAAHVLGPGPGVHESGDVVLYSPHKLAAIPEGGVAVIRPRAAHWAEPFATSLGRPAASPNDWRWLRRRLAQKLIPQGARQWIPQGGQARFEDDPIEVPLADPAAPSALARRLLSVVDLKREGDRRRDNQAALLRLIRKSADLAPLFESETAIPYRFALRCASPKAAAQRYARLRAARLPVETWPDLPPEVAEDPRHAEGAVALRRSVLLLPVHGALDPDRLAAAYAGALS